MRRTLRRRATALLRILFGSVFCYNGLVLPRFLQVSIHLGEIMYHAIRSQEVKKVLAVEGPSLIIAILVASTFYKFGSFLLELLAFLPTWYVLSLVLSTLGRRLGVISET